MKRGDLQTLYPMEETNYKDPKIPGLFMNTGRNKLHTPVYHNGANLSHLAFKLVKACIIFNEMLRI